MEITKSDNNLSALSIKLTRWLSLIVFLLPLLTLVGYTFAIPILTGAVAGFPPMRPISAIGLLITAFSIFLTSLKSQYKFLISTSALLCLVLGSFTFAGHFFPLQNSPTTPQAALNFILVSLSILIYTLMPNFIRLAQFMILAAGINSEIALTGYIFNANQVYGFPIYNTGNGMSIPTAICFILSGVALICSKPKAGSTQLLFREKSRSGAIARKLFLTIIFGPFAIGVVTYAGLALGLYEDRAHDAFFVLLLVTIIARTTWQSAKQFDLEEQRAEKALEEKQMFAAFVENSMDFAGITDANNQPIYLNPAGRKMIGMDLDYPIEMTNTSDYYSPEDTRFANDIILSSVMENGRWQGETNFRHWKSNNPIPVWHSYFLIRDQNTGKMLGTGTLTRDMTYRKALEDELRLSEAKSSGIISISTDAIISIDQEQNIILFNEGAEKIFGYDKSEILGKKLDLLIPERYRTPHQIHVANFSRSDSVVRKMGQRGSTIYGLRKNGEEFPADAAISKIDVRGNQIMTVTLRDITENVRIQKAQQFLTEVGTALSEGLVLESTLQKLAELVVKNLADICIIEIPCDGENGPLLKVVNNAGPEDNCIDCKNLINLINENSSSFSQVILRSHQPLLIENMNEDHLLLLSSNESQLHILKEMHISSLLSVPMLAHNKVIGTLAFVSATLHRQFHDTDLRLAEELAIRAALSIENSNLYNQAKNAIATREDILAVVSHDLKNPLTAIKLIGQTLQLMESPDKATCSRLAGKIESSARQMQVLIGDLLDFAKIESGTFSVTKTTENLMNAVRETIESMQVQAESQQQILICDLSADLPKVNIDLPRITQVVSNLVGNALKFTPVGGQIKLSAQVRRSEVLVSVSDTGAGIPPENLTKIFDRFWQAEATKHKGSGLGLSIAKGIIVAHGGKIWAESSVGQGTTIYFTVPLAPKISQEFENPTAPASSASTQAIDLSQPVLKGAKVLVVDDNADNLFLIKHLLESMGAEVTVAESVKSALSNIKFSMPNILFTDIEMPEEDGYDLLSQLRQSPDAKSKSIPVVALTAHSADKEMDRIKKAGFDFYLSKPVNLEKMISTILQVTKQESKGH